MNFRVIKAGACFLLAAILSYIGIVFPIAIVREYGWDQLGAGVTYSLLSLLIAAFLVWLGLRTLRKSN